MRILVTVAAGFIGYHLSERLLARGDEVVGLDNVNDYYSVALKRARIERLERSARFELVEADLAVEGHAPHAPEAAGFGDEVVVPEDFEGGVLAVDLGEGLEPERHAPEGAPVVPSLS